MSIDTENTKNKINSIVYEKPSLKKYGNMKELTFQLTGSGGPLGGAPLPSGISHTS